MQIFKGNENDLKVKFGLSPMSVVWVGILRSKCVLLTEPVLELCRASGPLESLLKNRGLLQALDNPKEFEDLQAQYDPNRQFRLVILNEKTQRILALEDEIAAEMGWKSYADVTVPAVVDSQLPMKSEVLPSCRNGVQAQRVIDGVDRLFSSEEVTRLKVAIATTVNAEEKIEAIRKIALAQIPANEKVCLFLHALADSHLQVRSEAATALGDIGFSSAITQAIITLSAKDENQRDYAISSLGRLFCQSSDVEKGVVLQVLISTLRDREYQSHWRNIIPILSQIARESTCNNVLLERIMNAAVEVLVSSVNEFMESIGNLFAEVLLQSPELMYNFLWNEIEKTQDRRARVFLMVFLAQARLDESRKTLLAQKMAMEFGLGDELDPVYLRLAGALSSLRETAIEALLDRFAKSATNAERMQAVRLIDSIVVSCNLPPSIKDRVLQTYIEVYPTALKGFRIVILDTPLLEDREVSPEIKSRFARESLLEIHKDKLENTFLAVKSALCRIKKPAIMPILKILENPVHSLQGIKVAEILGDVILELSESEREQTAMVKDFCTRQLDEGAPEHRGELFKVLGKVVAARSTDENLARETSNYLLDHLCKTTYPYGVLEGLGWAASAKATPGELKTDICYLFCTLMDRRLPQNLLCEKQQKSEKLFEFDFNTTAYTDLLPCLITGLRRIACGIDVSSVLRKKCVDHLIVKWTALATYRIIWGPKNTTDLAYAMRDICIHASTAVEDRLRLVCALLKKIELFSVMDLLTTIFPIYSDGEFAKLAAQVALKLLEFANHRDYQSAEDREMIMKCIGQLIESRYLAGNEIESQHIRERLLYTLFDGLREQTFGVEEILKRLVNSPFLTEELRKEIPRRIPTKLVPMTLR